MKRLNIILGATALVLILAGTAWVVGMVLEFEYPYTLVLMQARHARSVSGVPVSQIIQATPGDGTPSFHWHTCSYCADRCGSKWRDLLSIHLDGTNHNVLYYFAYSRKTDTLVPMSRRTAARFPALMPTNDQFKGVMALNGENGFYILGEDMELPEKWFRSETGTGPKQ